MDKSLNWDRFASIFLLVLCGLLWVETLSYLDLASLFPRIVILVLAVLSAVLLVKSWIKPDTKQIFQGIEKRIIALAIMLIALWVVSIPFLGLYLASILFFNLLVWLISGERRTRSAIAFSFVIVVSIVSLFYFVFQEILLVPFPKGILF
jgi:putative tricarboxylic transport membrane protein